MLPNASQQTQAPQAWGRQHAQLISRYNLSLQAKP